ncbi:putative E3 ubiquitin-protein ligase HIP1 isoform X2 [Tasmannia lanceolata]|uniref:putative E3 ubiquitin-protein ligase HIP1 isoform X2 n=1 Tax=Tasmannia lanceolata TaxID=3420 RepID=UPI00406469E6
MQGQKSTVQSLPDTFEFDHGSSSNNSSIDPQLYWNNMLNPVDALSLPDYLLSPSAYVNNDSGSLNSWTLGESSSGDHTLNQSSHDEAKAEHGWNTSLTTHAIPGLRLDERRFEPTNILSLESVNLNLNSDQVASEPLLFQNSNSDDIPPSRNLNAGFVGNGGQVMEAGNGSTDPCATASGTVEYFVEDGDGRPGCSLDGRRLSCKRKTIEGISGQSSLGGSSSVGHSVGHAVPARHNAASSLSISSPTDNFSGVNPREEHFNPRFGVRIRGIASDCHPGSGIAGNAETSQRNFRMRINPAHQQDSTTPNLWPPGNSIRRSHVCSPLQLSSRSLPFNHSLDLRPSATSTSSPQAQYPVPHIPGFPSHTAHPYPWSGAPNSRPGSSSSSHVIAGERPSLREEANSRGMPRNMSEHPMLVPPTEMRNLTQDPTNLSLINRNISTPGNIASSSRVGSSSVVHPSPGSTRVPHQDPLGQYPRRLSEAVRRSLFLSSGTESETQSGSFPPLHSVASTSSQEMVLPSGDVYDGHMPSYMRSAFRMDRQGDGVLGVPLSLRSLATAPEGRRRLASEIRNVLDLVRRGENLRFELVWLASHLTSSMSFRQMLLEVQN